MIANEKGLLKFLWVDFQCMKFQLLLAVKSSFEKIDKKVNK